MAEVQKQAAIQDIASIKTISADSHIAEPPNCFIDNIEAKFRDRAPYQTYEDGSDRWVVEGVAAKLNITRVAGAGKTAEEIGREKGLFSDVHRGAWDPKARMEAQDVDGVGGEVIYPTLGMLMCGHKDYEYKTACMGAYNRWLQGFCAAEPNRLFGIGQTPVTSVESAMADLRKLKDMGFVGAMLPYLPSMEGDYDSPMFDPLWKTAVELNMPISFHIVAGSNNYSNLGTRGPKLNAFGVLVRTMQELAGMFVLGGVFERNPKLKLVLVESDAGWAPHFASRMDHAYKYHRFWLKCEPMNRLPSEYFFENIYMTFQDDPIAFATAHLGNPQRLLWANDFPHSDSTWPHSQALLKEQTRQLTPQQTQWVVRDNVVDLYDLKLAA